MARKQTGKPKRTPRKRTAAKAPDPVKDYRHDKSKRLNNPPAGLTGQKPTVTAEQKQTVYDPHKPPVLRFDATGAADKVTDLLAEAKARPLTKDEVAFLESALSNHQPWLEWSGKREQKRVAVDDVAQHVHERVSAQAILRNTEGQTGIARLGRTTGRDAVDDAAHRVSFPADSMLPREATWPSSNGRRVVPVYRTRRGRMYCGPAEKVLLRHPLTNTRGKVQLVFTSPPFPLNRKKRYGNKTGDEYVEWLASFASLLAGYLTENGSIVLELGNCWEPGTPTMSTLALKAFLAFQEAGGFHLCQEFVCYNPARLPGPAQWVTVERIRLKDAFTRLWWLSPTTRPDADNRRVLKEYSTSMKALLRRGRYNAGRRPSEHLINPHSFLTDHGGAIPSNVLTIPNTRSDDPYQRFCRENGLRPHPARMPAPIAEFFISFLTKRGDVVLDPFAGSNTTGYVAECLRRRWLSIEMDETYAHASRVRFQPTSKEAA